MNVGKAEEIEQLEKSKYVNTSSGKIRIFFNENEIYYKSFRSKKERNEIMRYYRIVFKEMAYRLSFILSFTY